MKVLIATNNQGKLREIREILTETVGWRGPGLSLPTINNISPKLNLTRRPK